MMNIVSAATMRLPSSLRVVQSRLVSSSSTRGGGGGRSTLCWRPAFVAAGQRDTSNLRATQRTLSSSSSNNSNFFGNLRKQAANALTASLPDDDRKELLDKLMGPNAAVVKDDHAEEDDIEQTNTIAEAIAQARREEAERQESKWERERESILQEAQEAAQKRVESDLQIQQRRLAFTRWQEAVDQEKAAANQPPPALPPSQSAANDDTSTTATEVEEEATIQQETTKEGEDLDHHPILGKSVADLGYKRVHLVPATSLAAIPVWKRQRIYRHQRAKTMAADKMKSLHLGLPGVISLHEDLDGKLSILDGQHRVGMMSILGEKDQTDGGLDLDRVLVEVYPQGNNTSDNANGKDDLSEQQAQELFLEINKAEPVKLVDMPGVAKSGDRKVLTEAAARLQEAYPTMFSPSERCRAPHLNIDNLRDALFAADVMKRHGLKTSKAMHDWILQQNEALAIKYAAPEAQERVAKTAMNKAIKFHFYLGLESSWYYN